MLKVVLPDAYRLTTGDYSIEQEIFKENGMAFFIENCKTEEEVIEKCKDADAVITIYSDINPNVISKLEKCKVLVRYGIGYDNINVKAATEKNIFVCNIPDYCIDEVATHTAALILALERKIMVYDRSVRNGEWDEYKGYPVHSLNTQILGLLGFGNIARETAKMLRPFGFSIIAYDPYLNDDIFKNAGVKRVDLDQLWTISDVISVHVLLTDHTRHIINKESIAKMKKTVMVVNTSRGPIIDLVDLVAALKGGKILAAGLDVLENEPLRDKNAEILKLDNVIITPHAAFNTVESSQALHRKVAETVCQVLKGERPSNIVNKELIKR